MSAHAGFCAPQFHPSKLDDAVGVRFTGAMVINGRKNNDKQVGSVVLGRIREEQGDSVHHCVDIDRCQQGRTNTPGIQQPGGVVVVGGVTSESRGKSAGMRCFCSWERWAIVATEPVEFPLRTPTVYRDDEPCCFCHGACSVKRRRDATAIWGAARCWIKAIW